MVGRDCLCTNETLTGSMREALEDVGKWIFYVVYSAKQHNVPWNVIAEGICKAGAYAGYTEFSRTSDLEILSEEMLASDYFKAHGITLKEAGKNRAVFELNCIPMLEIAKQCTKDEKLLAGLEETYIMYYRGLFQSFRLNLEAVKAGEEGHFLLIVS